MNNDLIEIKLRKYDNNNAGTLYYSPRHNAKVKHLENLYFAYVSIS